MLIYARHDPRFHDRRLFKGGDGGAGDLRQQEVDRQAKVQSAVDAINTKFGKGPPVMFDEQAYLAANPDVAAQIGKPGQPTSGRQHFEMFGRNENRQGGVGVDPTNTANASARDALYADVSGATRDTALRGLDQQFTTASRQNLYGLADSGLLGGSADAEAGGDLQRRYGEGRIKAQALGDAAGATLQNNDEGTRQRLIQLAQSGLDTGTAANLAAGQLKAAGDVAASQTQTANVGNLFGDMSQAYLTNRTLAARYPGGLPTNAGQQVNYSSSGFAPSRYTGTSS